MKKVCKKHYYRHRLVIKKKKKLKGYYKLKENCDYSTNQKFLPH